MADSPHEQAGAPPPPQRADAAPAEAASAYMAPVDAALAGADTFVWGWDIDSDRFGAMDKGLAMLGHAPAAGGATQAAWDRLIHPDDRAANEAAYQRHARGEADTYEHAYRVQAGDGRWRWMLERGRLTYISDRGREIFGLTVDEVLHDINALWRAVDREDQRRMLVALRRSAATLTEWRCEFRTRRSDGQWRWLLGTAMPERCADGSMLWYGYAEDVTDRRELEQARRDAAVADAANRVKTEFLYRMSHELRTPLDAVPGFSQLMEIDRAEPPAPGRLRRLKLIREAGEHLLQMNGDMLDLTRIEAGGMALRPEPVPRANWPCRRWRWCARPPTRRSSACGWTKAVPASWSGPTARGGVRCC